MLHRLKLFYSFRHFLSALVSNEFKLRYKQSLLGLLWMIFEPLIYVLTLSLVFTLAGRHGPLDAPYPIYFCSGILTWNYFVSFINRGTRAFVSDKSLIEKTNYPREITVIKNTLVYFIDFLFSCVSFILLLLYFKYPTNIHYFYIPLLLGLQTLLGIGFMFFLASLDVYIRDVGILAKSFSTIWFWMTPVIFHFPNEGYGKIIYALNPMAGIISSYRDVIILNKSPNLEFLWPSIIASVIMLALGYFTFRKLQKGFADVL